MAALLELTQPLWVRVKDKGEARALILIDYGPEDDLQWICVMQEPPHTGEIWTVHNSEIRALANRSMLRGDPT